jgi:1,2-diacylglycerol 3-beta-galactosyltransferase
MNTRVVILMSDTGGGHRSAAEALAAVMTEGRLDDVQVELFDFIAEAAPWPLSRVGLLYEPAVNHLVWAWWALYHLTDGRRRIGLILRPLIPLVEPRLTTALASSSPDIIVSVHPLANHLAVRSAASLPNRPPVVTVVTDLLTTHAGWFHPGVRCCIVATEQARERALECGVPADKIAVVGLPVHPRFRPQAGSKVAVRRKLGLDPERFTALLVGAVRGWAGCTS